MNGFSNANIADKLCGGCDCTGFVPSVTFAYNAGANTIAVTDASTYPTGDARKIVQITVTDKNALKVVSNIPTVDVDNAVTVDVSTLDKSQGLFLAITVVSTKGCVSDGHFSSIGIVATSGAVGSWDKESIAITL